MLLENPAWMEVMPDAPQRQATDPSEEAVILAALNVEGHVYVAASQASGQHYFIETDSGRCLFVKRVIAEMRHSMQQTEDIAEQLYQQGVCVAPLLDVITLEMRNRKYHLWVYLYLQGRFCNPTTEDLSLLGGAIAKMHTGLKRNPNVLVWRENTLARYQQLEEIRQQVLANSIKNYHINETIYQLFGRFDFKYFLREGSTPLHGNLSTENYLTTLDKNICFFGFSNTIRSFQPAITELAYVVQHLILTRIEDDQDALSLGRTFVESYYAAGGDYLPDSEDQNCLYFLLLKAFSMLIMQEKSRISADTKAWKKLMYLLDIANERKTLFSKIFI